MGSSLSDSLVGWSVGGDTTCLNAALLVARLTFFGSVDGPFLHLLLLATRKEECGRSSLPAYIPFFCLRALLCVLGIDIDVEIKRKLYLQIDISFIITAGGWFTLMVIVMGNGQGDGK